MDKSFGVLFFFDSRCTVVNVHSGWVHNDAVVKTLQGHLTGTYGSPIGIVEIVGTEI